MPRPLRVLIAEDRPTDAELVVRELRRAGFAPDWQRVDTEAEFAASLRPDLDVILSDYEMPEFSGFGALEVLHERGLDIPFIIVSGTIGEETAVAAMKRGATDYLLKDRLTRLGPAVSQALDQARLRKQSKRAEEELDSASAQLQRLLDHSPAVIYTLKVEGARVVLSLVSENIIRLLGFSVESCDYAWWEAHLHPEDRDRALASIPATLELGGVRCEYRLRHQDGSYLWVEDNRRLVRDAAGRPGEIVGVWTEITERKRTEEVLKESERRFREMLENVELIALTLDKNGMVTFCNDYLLRVTGWTREAAIGADWFSRFIPQANGAVKKQFFEMIEAGEFPTHHQNPIITKTGELREIAWNNTMLRDIAGKIVGTASLGEDVTERKRAEAAIREQEEAGRANRAKSEFLSDMSHELRTPLHAILGFAQLLETDGQSPNDAESVAQILRAGKHLLGLINEVLDIARVESGKLPLAPEPVNVRATLEETLSLVQPLAAQRRVRIEPLVGALDCEVLSSTQRFKQVILNLLSNAVKFNREGGSVAVSSEKIGDCLRIKVADTGRGISAENIAKLFVPFERLDAGETVIEGAGLGLSISKHLVEAMGGRIGVESVPGKGTTFWVELPLIQATPTATAGNLKDRIPSLAEPPHSTTPRTLLYIEDNLSNLRLVERILAERPEVKLISAMQGSIGLELARQHQPDLLLLDLHLPDIQGDEILRQLRADPRTERLPIVMISADATSAQIERLRAAGANDYLTKPIDVRRFLAVIDATAPRSAEPPRVGQPSRLP